MSRRLVAAMAGLLALVGASAVHAAPFTSGSFAFNAVTTSTTDVTTSTVFPLLTPTIQPNIGVDDFAGAPLPPSLTLPAGAVDFNLVGCCNWSDPLIGSFIGTTVPVRTQTTPHPNGSATWDVEGLFTVGPFWDNAGLVRSANITWSLTQTGGPRQATSVSGSFHSPSTSQQVPEPATLALAGMGLAGIAASRRRRQN